MENILNRQQTSNNIKAILRLYADFTIYSRGELLQMSALQVKRELLICKCLSFGVGIREDLQILTNEELRTMLKDFVLIETPKIIEELNNAISSI